MTPAEHRCLAAVRKLTLANGHPPSQRDVQRELGYASVSAVSMLMSSLVDQGFMLRDARYGRRLELAGSVSDALLESFTDAELERLIERCSARLDNRAARLNRSRAA